MAKVTYSQGFTLNMGDFESLRMDIGIEDDTRPGESVPEAEERLFKFVSNRLKKRVAVVREELKAMENQGGY